jgi:hypothetical protein
MEFDNGTVKQRIYVCTSRAYEWLFGLAIHSGNWKEVRSTALVGLCLSLREPKGSPWLVAVKNWLIEQQVQMGTDKASWGEELWDTSMALISLNSLGFPHKDPRFKNTLNWMQSLYNVNGRCNWHDEPWETSWSVLAILETDPTQELTDIAYNAAKWLLSLQDSEGKIVSPHYTAYFISISHKLKIKQEDKDVFNTAITRATEYLVGAISERTLWTGEAWSNGQILWILASTKKFPCDNNSVLLKVINWFANNQESDGNWKDVEDTASSILGLCYLLRELESTTISSVTELDTLIFTALRRNLHTPVLCIKRKFIETHEDGTTSINLSPRFKKLAAIIATIASGATVIITFWDFIKGLLGG